MLFSNQKSCGFEKARAASRSEGNCKTWLQGTEFYASRRPCFADLRQNFMTLSMLGNCRIPFFCIPATPNRHWQCEKPSASPKDCGLLLLTGHRLDVHLAHICLSVLGVLAPHTPASFSNLLRSCPHARHPTFSPPRRNGQGVKASCHRWVLPPFFLSVRTCCGPLYAAYVSSRV